MDPVEKRRIVETITEKVVVGKDEIDITLCYLPPCKDMAKRWRKGVFMRPFCRLVIKAVRGDSPPFLINGRPLGELLIRRRAELKLTQAALAKRLGVCRKTLANWENSQSKPISDVWRKIRCLLTSHRT